MNDLDEIEARLLHIYWEVSELNRYILDGAGVETQISRDKGMECLSARMTQKAEISARRKVADILTEYRSILNGIAAVLVTRALPAGAPALGWAHDFPAYKVDYDSKSRGFYGAITARDAQLVPRCDNIDNIIVQLAERDNKRKHRLLTVVTVVQTGMRYGGAVTIGNSSGSNVRLGSEWTPIMYGEKLDRSAKPRVTLEFPETFGRRDASVTGWIGFVRQFADGMAATFKLTENN